MDKCILESTFKVPTHMVSLSALDDFKKKVKDDEGEDLEIQFFRHNAFEDYYEFQRGDLALIRKHFGHLPIEDRRIKDRMSCEGVQTHVGNGLIFDGSLRTGQQNAVNQLLKADPGLNLDYQVYGQLDAPPRFGKTVVMTWLTAHFGMKTLLLSHQIDLCEQAIKTFYKFTNIMDLEYELEKPIIGLVREWEDLDKYDVCFMPYQKFVTGKNCDEMLEIYKNKFGLLLVDEIHKATAPQYSRIVSSFNASVRIGVTGTVERKNGMHVVNNYTVGPVMAKGEAEQVPCLVKAVFTKIGVPGRSADRTFFTKMLTHLSKDASRNHILIQTLYQYWEAGFACIAVTDRTAHCDLIADTLKNMGIKAEAFHAKKFKGKFKNEQREELLQKARDGEIDVLICMRSMVLGLDIPRMTAFFNLLPTANGPNYYQEFSRVRTPYDGKDTSIVVDFIDGHPMAYACYKTRLRVYKKYNLELGFGADI